MSEPKRISPEKARELERSGKGLLVCAYEDDEKFMSNRLEGAISLSEFASVKSRVGESDPIVFY